MYSPSPPRGPVEEVLDTRMTPKETEKSTTQYESWKARACVLMWFGLSIAVSNLTKWCYLNSNLCHKNGKCRRFDFPIFITACHMLCSWVLCSRYAKTKLPQSDRFRRVLPLALMFALSVGAGNLSLYYIYPTFTQMVSNCTPVITMLMQMLFLKTEYNWWGLVSVTFSNVQFRLFT